MPTPFRTLATAFLAMLVATPAAATEEDTQLWVYLNAAVPLGEGVTGTFELSPRFREGPEQMQTRAAVDFDLNDDLTLGGAVVWTEFAGGSEWRAQQQLGYSRGPLSLRTRLEERFFEGADRAQIRFRQQAKLAFPLDDATQLSGGVEFLYILRDQMVGGDDRIDNWRFEVAARRRLSAHFDATLAYRAILAPRPGQEDKLSHVPVITLAWKP